MAKMTENDKIARYGAIVQLVGSRSKPDQKPYEVRFKDGVHSCNCTGFVMSKEVPKSCKHIKAYLVEKGKTQKAVELTEIQITEKCLRTAGCYDPLKESCISLQAFQHKVARLALALMPYLGGQNPDAVASNECSGDDVRLITLDD
jgi:hypothetical protein